MFSAKVNDFLESRTPSGGPPSDLEWPGFPTPQPGKTKYSSLSQISLRINKKSNVTLLVPRSPPGHLAKHPLSPNIGMDIEPRTCIIHPLYHSVISNMRPDLMCLLREVLAWALESHSMHGCHPCGGWMCVSSEITFVSTLKHNHYKYIFHVMNTRVPP